MVTGANGMLGQDVGASAQARGHEVIARARSELDITDAAAVRRAVLDERPDAVINCAAYTDVDGAESNPQDAHAVNGEGARHVAVAAASAGAWTVHVSTDYVFDGRGSRPYVESDPVGPRSQYGHSKLAGERAVAAASPQSHTIVRTAWLFGAGGACFPATIMRLARERDELSVVADQLGCPTFTGHLAAALVDLVEQPPAGVVHASAAGSCSWYDFAREIVQQGGIDCAVHPVTTADFPRPAPRPAYSVLGSERGALAPRLPDWREGLAEYLSLSVSAT